MSADPPSWLERLRGRFLVLDGPDGSGKSTQLRRFSEHVQQAGVRVCEVREPGGTPVGERIRQVLLDTSHADMDVRCEMMLYMASRAQLMAERIRPALERGELVLADRFISSTLAYQGAAGGIPGEDVQRVGTICLGRCWPDLIVIFDLDEKTAAERLMGTSKLGRVDQAQGANLFSDRMEQKGADYQRRVRQGFLDQAQADPDRHLVVAASADAQTIFEQLMSGVKAAAERRF